MKCYFKIQNKNQILQIPATLDGECYPKTVYAVVASPTRNYWPQYTIAISLTGATFSANKLTGHFILAIVQKIEVSNRIRNEVEGRNDASKSILACMVT